MVEGEINLTADCTLCGSEVEIGLGYYDSQRAIDIASEDIESEFTHHSEVIESGGGEYYAICKQCQRDALHASQCKERDLESRIADVERTLAILNTELTTVKEESKNVLITRIRDAT